MTTKKHDDRELFFEWGVHFPTRTIELFEDIEECSVARVIKGLHMLDAESNQPITLKMCTPGGSMYQGFALYSAIKHCASPVTIEASGHIMSMGVFVLQAADHRVCVDSLMRLMVHEIQLGGYDTYATEYEASFEDLQALKATYREVLLFRIRQKRPKYKAEDLDKLIKGNKFFDVTTALTLGLIDEVL